MDLLNFLIGILAFIALFIHGLKGFSKEIEAHVTGKIKVWLDTFTSNRFRGFILGFAFTAIIQSSSAVSSIVTAFVDLGIISFRNSLPILFGSNVGTTITAWIVTLKLTKLGAFLIFSGWLISLIPFKIKVFGKSIFYFGLIFFSLELISLTISSIGNEHFLHLIFDFVNNPLKGLLVGALLTMIVQSSSVVTGVAIILVGEQLLTLPVGISLLLGSNIGTTSTAIFSSIEMNENSKKTAFANLVFNITGAILFFPFIGYISKYLEKNIEGVMFQIATAHLVFNFVIAIIYLFLLDVFVNLINKTKFNSQKFGDSAIKP
jgi:phosphate:Na+ symporter